MDPAATEEPLIAEDVMADICMGGGGGGGGSGGGSKRVRKMLRDLQECFIFCLFVSAGANKRQSEMVADHSLQTMSLLSA